MPRDGSGIYTRPFLDVVAGTTIESAVHNGTVSDIEIDLNAPRPIVAGGTGANNAKAARDNLDCEVALQVVTNYESHVWEAGSFRSAIGATGAPNPTENFSGVCHLFDPSSCFLEARAYEGTNQRYFRRKYANTWYPWVNMADEFVGVTGDTMTGNLSIAKASPQLVLSKSASGQANSILGMKSAVSRWQVDLGDGLPETGSNNGSDFAVSRYSDAGALLNAPLVVSRATGDMTLNSHVTATGRLMAAKGNPIVALDPVGTAFGLISGGNLLFFQTCTAVGAPVATKMNLDASGNVTVTAGGWKPGGGPWSDTSDARIKNVVGDYDNGLASILTLNPVRFTFKGNETHADMPPSNFSVPQQDVEEDKSTVVVPYANSPHHGAATNGKEYVGLIAQDCEAAFPEMVSQRTAMIDGQPVTDMRDLDTTPLMFALINAVKEMAARIEALEAKVA